MTSARRLVLLILIALLCLLPAPATAAEYLSHQRYALDNGLDVVLHVDRKLPVVAVNLTYHVGSMHDGAHPGLAHLVEHLMFRGTRDLEDGEFGATLQRAGGIFNAVTDRGRTSYHALLPAKALPTALWLESNRMAYLLPALDAAKVTTEIQTTTTEWQSKGEGQRFGTSAQLVWHTLFPPGHPFNHAAPQQISQLRIDDVRQFVQRYHGPANATLVLAGDLPTDVRDQVQRYFGRRQGGERPTLPAVTAAAPTGERRLVRQSELATTPLVVLAWQTPAMFQPGDADADVLMEILRAGLEPATEALAPGMFLHLEVQQFSWLGSSGFALLAEGVPSSEPIEMLAILDTVLVQLRETPPSSAELRRAQKQLTVRSLRSMGQLDARADRMQVYITAGKPPDWVEEDLARYEAVDAHSLMRFVGTYLRPELRVVLLASPAREGRVGSTPS